MKMSLSRRQFFKRVAESLVFAAVVPFLGIAAMPKKSKAAAVAFKTGNMADLSDLIYADLSDLIYEIEPTDVPFMSVVEKPGSTTTVHEWQTDKLEKIR